MSDYAQSQWWITTLWVNWRFLYHWSLQLFNDSRACLQLAQNELNIHIQPVSASSMNQYAFNISKLSKILEWEILLVDVGQLFQEWPKHGTDLVIRCKECLHCFKNQTSDVNPRSEIIENLLMALLNFGEFDYVATFDQIQQRLPFLDFLSLLAKVCLDLGNGKDSSASYRELWHSGKCLDWSLYLPGF